MTHRPPPVAAVDALVSWFSDHGKDYPWRRTADPYAVLVSEMMLQQTQVKTVLERGYFARWMEKFPTPAALADAGESEVLRCWEGLGYYARARNLLKAARAVVADHGGVFPVTVEGLEALPGIGPYTARAVAAFAHDLPVPVLDANVIRVAARLLNFREPVDSSPGPKILKEVVARMVPASGGRAFNSALMELGQTICLPRKPDCPSCPVARWCAGCGHSPESLPIKRPRRETVAVDEHAIFARNGGKILLHRESGRRRQGLWKLPERQPDEISPDRLLLDTRYSITHHRVRLRVYRAQPGTMARDGEKWIPLADLASHPMPAPYRKALDILMNG